MADMNRMYTVKSEQGLTYFCICFEFVEKVVVCSGPVSAFTALKGSPNLTVRNQFWGDNQMSLRNKKNEGRNEIFITKI